MAKNTSSDKRQAKPRKQGEGAAQQAAPARPLPLLCVGANGLAAAQLSDAHRAWAQANQFSGQPGRLLALPDAKGKCAGYLFGTGGDADRAQMITGLAAASLPPGAYELAGDFGDPGLAALGFDLGAYQFNRYKKATGTVSRTPVIGADEAWVARLRDGAVLARDLINMPANDLGPEAFEGEVRVFAKTRAMTLKAIVGDELLEKNCPLIHAVGRASAQAPRLLELNWGAKKDPLVTLVGKGVTFDSGGLDIKSAAGMLLMKKDMSGAANILGLAHAIVDAGLKLRLRVLLPIVENAIAGNAFRPGDIVRARNGLRVEIGNTDAEGRLILADALAMADEKSPELIVDMATLTGGVALGPELPALFTPNDRLAEELYLAGLAHNDPLWRLPLWRGYERLLGSRIADVNHVAGVGSAGASIAALFLQRFVKKARDWAHFDIFGWASEARPARPQGGTDQAMRAVYAVLAQKYGA